VQKRLRQAYHHHVPHAHVRVVHDDHQVVVRVPVEVPVLTMKDALQSNVLRHRG
jgi:hypothetical protein